MTYRLIGKSSGRVAISALLGLGLALLATHGAAADAKSGPGGGAACKAPTGETFGLGETIKLTQTDAHGNFVTVTYQCTENGWVKVSAIGPANGHHGLPLAPLPRNLEHR